jgi:cytochrome c
MHRVNCFLAAVLLALPVACTTGGGGGGGSGTVTPPTTQTVFQDDFDGDTLADGWTVLREDQEHYSLTQRSGYLRIITQEGSPGAENSVNNLVVRDFSGSFTITTQIEFTPEIDRQFAGLVIQDADGLGVSLGLTQVSDSRGTVQGAALLAYTGTGSGSSHGFEVSTDPSVSLRLQRDGDTITASFSANGVTYTEVGSVIIQLQDAVQVGIGAANGSQCGANCDQATSADFDSFEIAQPVEE